MFFAGRTYASGASTRIDLTLVHLQITSGWATSEHGLCMLSFARHRTRMEAELLPQRRRFSIQGDFRLHRAMCVPALSFVIFATSAAAQPAITRPDGGKLTPAQIDSTVNRLIQAAHVTGAGVALFHRGEIVYFNAYGLRDTEKGLPLTPDSAMTAASLNQSAFATVVMRLVQRGTLDLDRSSTSESRSAISTATPTSQAILAPRGSRCVFCLTTPPASPTSAASKTTTSCIFTTTRAHTTATPAKASTSHSLSSKK